jgi:hypothetical protein
VESTYCYGRKQGGVTLESDLNIDGLPVRDISRYASLGLLANPFEASLETEEPGVQCEIAAQANKLLSAILEKTYEDQPKPIWVEKTDLPSYYALTAGAMVESTLARDESFNVLYAYVQLFMMKIGPVRATLGITSERISFREFDQTLAAYVARVLAEPDTDLPSYQILGPQRLADFAARFEVDPLGELAMVFGEPEIERRPELAEHGDLRRLEFDSDGVEADSDREVDEFILDAPGTDVLLAETADAMDDDATAILDYLVEYTREHLSAVLARGFRVYRERGIAALSDELRITKAPRKTLAKLIEFAGVRYRKCVFIFDAFENWLQIAPDLRAELVGSFTDLRWKLAGGSFPVFIVAEGEAPELEETFGGGARIVWDFAGLAAAQEQEDVIVDGMVDAWLASASLASATPLTVDDGVLSAIREASGGSLKAFCRGAYAAFEDAVGRGVSVLDDSALAAGKAALGDS